MIRLAVILMCMAGQASALSCLPHAVEDAFNQANDAPEVYQVVHGRLAFDGALLPRTDHDPMHLPEDAVIPARIVGNSLTRNGFTNPVALNVTFEVQCYASWCGGGVPGADYLAFLRQDAGTWVLQTNPCGGFAFAKPSRVQLDAVEACLRAGSCDAPVQR